MRIYNERNEPLDYCRTCYPGAKDSYLHELEDFSDKSWSLLDVEGGSTREEFITHIEDDEDVSLHPDYDDCNYDCESCGKKLTEKGA